VREDSHPAIPEVNTPKIKYAWQRSFWGFAAGSFCVWSRIAMPDNVPPPPPDAPDEDALAYLKYASEVMADQVAAARCEGQQAPAALLLPHPPRLYDRQLIISFVHYFFIEDCGGLPVPPIHFADNGTVMM
jgi:hypothetical protein